MYYTFENTTNILIFGTHHSQKYFNKIAEIVFYGIVTNPFLPSCHGSVWSTLIIGSDQSPGEMT